MKSVLLFITCMLISLSGRATEPPANGGTFPDAYFERLANNPRAFTYKRALHDVTSRASVARAISVSANALTNTEHSKLSGTLMKVLGVSAIAFNPIEGGPPTMVSGTRNIPVLTVTFPETVQAPYPVKNLQTELFDGPWPSGTMTEYYSEVSGGALTVKGSVKDWTRLKKSSQFYVGDNYINSKGVDSPCYGLCTGSRVADFVIDSLRSSPGIDWGKYDNDGPDGIPNSGDDDGYVDFVAFVHPNVGSECGTNTDSIWSHRSSITSWGRPAFVTKSPKKGGGFITIDDYVIMPALACDGKTMIQIGVFAHEFGHAFGLPDLYDTDSMDGKTAGLGNWCLMASGSWGGDGKSPSIPSHMSPWAKAFLGWVNLKDVDQDMLDLNVAPIEESRTAYRLRISSKMYYIVNSVDKTGFNRSLPAPGLQVWRVNETVVKAGLSSNRVNAVNFNRGVLLVEADGMERMMSDNFRGDEGDIFPGSTAKSMFDSTSKPMSDGSVSICNIHRDGNHTFASFKVSTRVCNNGGLVAGPPQVVPVSDPAGGLAPASALSPPISDTRPPVVSVAQATTAPTGASVSVTGTLMNSGSNFFDRKTRRIVLIDKAGSEIEVTPRMVLEQSPPDLNGAKPHLTISEVLNKEVTITGKISSAIPGKKGSSLQADVIDVKK